jgi:hypothetical protein
MKVGVVSMLLPCILSTVHAKILQYCAVHTDYGTVLINAMGGSLVGAQNPGKQNQTPNHNSSMYVQRCTV